MPRYIATTGIYLLAPDQSPRLRNMLLCYHSITTIEDVSTEGYMVGSDTIKTRILLNNGKDFLSFMTVEEWAKLIEAAHKQFMSEDVADDAAEDSTEQESGSMVESD